MREYTINNISESPIVTNKVQKQKQSEKEKLSILLFLNGGMSHARARRVLNSTYYYLLNEQEAVPLHGYHAVGQGLQANIVPYLTGEN